MLSRLYITFLPRSKHLLISLLQSPSAVILEPRKIKSISWNPLKLMSIELVMLSNHLILCHPLLLLPSTFLSIRVFSNELALCIRWPKYWSFSLNISPSNEHSGLVSFRMDWLDLLAVQETLKSLLKNHSWKASILRCSAFFTAPTLTSIHDHWKNHSLD